MPTDLIRFRESLITLKDFYLKNNFGELTIDKVIQRLDEEINYQLEKLELWAKEEGLIRKEK